jgi:lon-related putative ATP-dependent protease
MTRNNNKQNGPPSPLSVEQVLRRCDPGELGFETTADVEPLVGLVGQSRALGALEFGARMEGDGFNIYALGTPGSQRHEVVSHFLQEESRQKPQPVDWCYLNNFADPQKPKGVAMAAGQGIQLKQDMDQLVEDLQASIPAAFESENYRNRRAEIEEEFNEQNKQAQEAVQAEAEKEGLGLLSTPHGFAIAPTREGRPLAEEEFLKLPAEQRELTQRAIERVSVKLGKYFENLPTFHKERRRRVKELDNNVTMFAVGSLIEDLRGRYEDYPSVIEYLNAVQEDVINNAQDFGAGESQADLLPPGLRPDPKQRFKRYDVNVLVDNASTEGAPVTYESHPTYQNLVGRVEHASQFGALVTDFTMIRPGALHAANGGYLIIDAEKVLLQPYAWEGLKRVIQTNEIRIESLGQMLSLISTQGLEPDAMPLKVKIVLIGNRFLYYLLCQLDPDFQQFFKVAADFEDRIPRSPENLELYGRMLASIVQNKSLRPFGATGIARVIEESSRWIGDTEKLSASMRTVTDLMSEADYCAGQRSAPVVEMADVEKAIEQRTFRLDRIRSQLQEAIQRKTIHISTDGEAVGQVNGLSVLQLGDFMFGQPSRITATARLGAGKVVDIEREVELGGAIHSKGVLIISSYLGSRYTTDLPLSLSASLVFEQSYGQIEGDSASVAELVALLSAIADVPIRQSLAITGSVDQKGVVQAIGGVNQKIEGFFDTCKARDLSGEQGVLIPADNVQHLMLRRDVAEAIAKKQFHIYPLTHVDEAIALLTGREAGERDTDGAFPHASVNGLVEQALRKLAGLRQSFASGSEAGPTASDDGP